MLRPRLVYPAKGFRELSLQRSKQERFRAAAGNYNVVEAIERCSRRYRFHDRLKSSPDPVPSHRIAEFLGNREAEPRADPTGLTTPS